jgi:spoIIIJ-associated protein
MTDQELKKAKEIIEEFFAKACLGAEVSFGSVQNQTLPVDLKMDEPQAMIGERGQTLSEVQRLLKMIVKKQTGTKELFYLDVDINDYKKKKSDYLREVARTMADEVSLINKERELPPMSPYERRVVHSELASRIDIITESVGLEPDRRVIIKPKPAL